MMSRLPLIGVAAATLFASVSLGAQTTPPAAAPAGDGLPDGPGRATLVRVCSGCHEPTVVTQHRMKEKDWHDLVEMMAGNGAMGTDADFAEITAYLAKNFPPAAAQ